MATTTATFERIAHSCEMASDSALRKGVAQHKALLTALFEKWADEVKHDRHMGAASHELEIEIEGRLCVIDHQEAKPGRYGMEIWSVWHKAVPATPAKASEQQARLGRLFGNK